MRPWSWSLVLVGGDCVVIRTGLRFRRQERDGSDSRSFSDVEGAARRGKFEADAGWIIGLESERWMKNWVRCVCQQDLSRANAWTYTNVMSDAMSRGLP